MFRNTILAALFVALLSPQAFAYTSYFIYGSGTQFSVKTGYDNESILGTTNQPIQTIVNRARSDANGDYAIITFGCRTYPDHSADNNILNIGNNSVSFTNTTGTGGTWGAVSLYYLCNIDKEGFSQTGGITSTYTVTTSGTINISIDDIDVSTTVQNTSSGNAIYNSGTGTVTISGTVSATTGSAIYNNSTGKITVKEYEDIEVTSANPSTTSGTIHNQAGGTIEILGGTVSNTASNGNAVYLNNASGSLVLGGSTFYSPPTITGNIRGPAGRISVNRDFKPGSNVYTLSPTGTVALGDVAVVGGGNFANNFTLVNSNGWGLVKSGDDLVIAEMNGYSYTKSGTKYTINGKSSAYATVQAAINAIRTDANGGAVTIQFGNGTETLDIGSDNVSFSGTWGKVNIEGKITSTSTNGTIDNATTGTIEIASGSVANTGNTTAGIAVNNAAGGTVTISGGTVSATAGYAVLTEEGGTVNISGGTVSANTGWAVSVGYNSKTTVSGDATVTSAATATSRGAITVSNGTVEIFGGTVSNTASGFAVFANSTYASIVLGGNPTINGAIRGLAGTQSVKTANPNIFAPTSGKVYSLTLGGTPAVGNVAVTGGASFINNFTLTNAFGLTANGNNIVLRAPYYLVTGSGTSFTAMLNGATAIANGSSTTIANVLTAIRTNANGGAISIQFGNGTDTLNIGTASATFNSTGGTWGTVTIEGKITSANEADDYNSGTITNSTTGTIEILGLVRNTAGSTGIAVYNGSTGTVTINGGTAAANTGYAAVSNGSTGTITISNGTVSTNSGTAVRISGGTVNISGGTVSATSGTAILNSGGTVNISGGTVSATTGIAVSSSTGKITVSSNAAITSAVTNVARGTIYNTSNGTIEILGGTVANTASNNAVYLSNANGSIVLGGSPTITGNISGYAGRQSVNTANPNIFAPGTKTYTLTLGSTLAVGNVAVVGGAGHIANFALTNTPWKLAANNNDIIITQTYTVTFKDYDGSIITTETVNHGSAATAPTAPTREGYTFTGWSTTFNNITSDLTVTAQYNTITHTVTFKDHDGSTLKTEEVEHGSAATAPTAPTRAGYTFASWDITFTNVTSNLTVTALYTKDGDPITYTVTFLDHDGTVLKRQEGISPNAAATAPTVPARPGYTFTGWSGSFTNVTTNFSVTAEYEAIVYTVVFKDWNGTELETVHVHYGQAATAPSSPARAGYAFTGWDKAFTNVTADLTVTAQYSIITHTVVFKNWDGAVLKTETVNEGAAATAPSVPARAGYAFVKCDAEFGSIVGDLVVTAVYAAETPSSSSTDDPSSSSADEPSSSSADEPSSSSVEISSGSVEPSSSSVEISSGSVEPSSSSVELSSGSADPSSSSADIVSSSSGNSTPIARHVPSAINSETKTYYTIKGEPVGSVKPAKPGVYLVKQGNSIRKIVVK